MLVFTRIIFFLILFGAMVALLTTNPITFPGDRKFGGAWQFLTVWNQTLQIIVFGYFVLFGTEEKKFHSLFERLFVLSTATSIVVVSMFWALHMQGAFGEIPLYPWWLNHAQHTIPLFATLTELYLHEHKFGSLRGDIRDVLVYGGAYGLWILACYSQNRYWPYPFLKFMNLTQWIVLTAFTFGFLVFAHLVSRGVHHVRHGRNK
jgi:hypothetical protein